MQKKQDLRIKKTVNLIRNNFLELLKENDYKSITIDELCQKAEISRNTFYIHYDNKQDLIEHIVDKILKPVEDIYETNYHNGIFCNEVYEKVMKEQIEYIDKNKEVFSILFSKDDEIYFSAIFIDKVKKIALKNIRNLRLKDSLENRFCTNYNIVANVASMKYWLENYDKYTPESVFKLLAGLSNESLNFICKNDTKK